VDFLESQEEPIGCWDYGPAPAPAITDILFSDCLFQTHFYQDLLANANANPGRPGFQMNLDNCRSWNYANTQYYDGALKTAALVSAPAMWFNITNHTYLAVPEAV
jgi:hypothetical protein